MRKLKAFLLRFPTFRSIWNESLSRLFTDNISEEVRAEAAKKGITDEDQIRRLIQRRKLDQRFQKTAAVKATVKSKAKETGHNALLGLWRVFVLLLAIVLPILIFGWSFKTFYLILFLAPSVWYLQTENVFMVKLQFVSIYMVVWLLVGIPLGIPFALHQANYPRPEEETRDPQKKYSIKQTFYDEFNDDWMARYHAPPKLSRTTPLVITAGKAKVLVLAEDADNDHTDFLIKKHDPIPVVKGMNPAVRVLYENSGKYQEAKYLIYHPWVTIFLTHYWLLWLIAITTLAISSYFANK